MDLCKRNELSRGITNVTNSSAKNCVVLPKISSNTLLHPEATQKLVLAKQIISSQIFTSSLFLLPYGK